MYGGITLTPLTWEGQRWDESKQVMGGGGGGAQIWRTCLESENLMQSYVKMAVLMHFSSLVLALMQWQIVFFPKIFPQKVAW